MSVPEWSDVKREATLAEIREIEKQLYEVANQYTEMRKLAENNSTDMFLAIVEAAGSMTIASLRESGNLMLAIWQTMKR